MAKVVFLAALVAAMVAVTVAQVGESEMSRYRDRQCMREVQDSPLDACRQVMERQLTGMVGRRAQIGLRAQLGLRAQCCQQLQDVSRDCRCAAIRQMVLNYEESMPMPFEQQQQQQRYYGEEQQEYYGEEHYGEEGYYGEQQQPQYYPQPQQQPGMTRVRLTRARQYASQLPAMCRVEPQQCSIFSTGQY
uniref:Bifunctional inhibitor/plant lipid transfer protein/seed storage helical domain-containing protein n=1 Tax=Leersia perrieri TaxID=77586 RepID=A0A0D9WI94_9ORYZ